MDAGGEQQAEAAAAVERETRLARVVDQLRRRLEQQQAENEQLEDLLRQADASLGGTFPLLYLSCSKVAASFHHQQQQRAETEQLRALLHKNGNGSASVVAVPALSSPIQKHTRR